MAIEIKPHAAPLEPAVRAFNERLRAGGVAYSLHERHVSDRLPRVEGRALYQETFVAVEDGETVRGGYVLQHQPFAFRGEVRSIASYLSPVSEGVLDARHNLVGVQLIRHALKRQPLLFGLGFGSAGNPLAQMMKAMGFALYPVPFHFRVVRPVRFLRHIEALRTTRARRALFDVAAATGVGWLGLRLLQWTLRRSALADAPSPLPDKDARAELESDWGDWADEVWRCARDRYAMAAVRDRASLDLLYPLGDRSLRLRVTAGGRTLGWAVALDTAMSGHKQFGRLRVGTLVDGFALPEDAAAVIAAATRFLERRAVDLIVSNQRHDAWSDGLRRAGFLGGPTNYFFTASKRLAERVHPIAANIGEVHITRGDGDGPLGL